MRKRTWRPSWSSTPQPSGSSGPSCASARSAPCQSGDRPIADEHHFHSRSFPSSSASRSRPSLLCTLKPWGCRTSPRERDYYSYFFILYIFVFNINMRRLSEHFTTDLVRACSSGAKKCSALQMTISSFWAWLNTAFAFLFFFTCTACPY